MREASPPKISVIVPVRDRRALLRQLLDSLAAQTYTDFEVLVVDDGSRDGTPEEARADEEAGRPVRVIANEGVGAYAGRRTGVAASNAPYLAFTDSDCVADPKWLEAGVAALDAGADVANGFTEPTRPPRPLERTMWSGEEGLYPTCNVFYRRSAYDRAGGFDAAAADRFGFPSGTRARSMGFGEDTLLGWTVRRSGTATYVREAVVRHEVMPPDLGDSFRRTWMMVAFPALFREVPELRRPPLMRHGVVLSTPDRRPLYAMLAAVMFRRRLPALAAGAWWVAVRARELRDAPTSTMQQLQALPVQLGLDVVAAAALGIGSVRYRTIVL
jgi:glycosyltransferase involved in cell wall biosynthesis